jgi:stage V sporulation protein S
MMRVDQSTHQKGNKIDVTTLTHPYPVAEAIAHNIRKDGVAEIQAMGASAVTKAVTAISIAWSYLLSDGIEITWKSELADVVSREYEFTATRIIVERRPHDQPQNRAV